MKLLDTIDQAITSAADPKRLRSLRGILTDFLAKTAASPSADADLLLTLTPGWAQRFAQYLSTYPNRLKNAGTPYLSPPNQRLYLSALRAVLRRAAAAAAYPDIDPILPLLDKPDQQNTRSRRLAPPVDLHAQLRRLCTLRLTGHEAALRNAYYLGLAAGGIELKDIAGIKTITTAAHTTLQLSDGTPITTNEALVSLLNALRIPATHDATPAEISSSSLRKFFAQRDIRLYQSGSIFSDLLALALPAVGPDAVARAAETRLLRPADYLRDIAHYQSLLSRNCSDYGMLTQRWYAVRSVSPRQSGADIERAILKAPDEISSLVSDIYTPNDMIVVERNGTRTTRNHPAVRSLVFVKALRTSIPLILKYVGNAAAYKRTADAADGYSPVPYTEIYRMKLVLGAVGADPTTEIYTNAELREHFPVDPLAVGDLVTVAKPGYEQFTARVIRCKGRDHYCVTFEDFGFNLIMTDIPRVLLSKN